MAVWSVVQSPPRHPAFLSVLRTAFLLTLFLAQSLSAKTIRLRNDPIDTPPRAPLTAPAAAALAAARGVPVTGLFLVQFTEPLRPEWREQVAAAGVDLLRYVPDDAFLARLDNVALQQLTALPFIQWVGPYTPAQKIFRGLQPPSLPQGPLTVSVLLAPRAPVVELAQVRRMFLNVKQESYLRFGGVVRGTLPPSRLAELASSSAVLWIENDRPMRLNDEIASKIIAGDAGPGTSQMQALGFDGTGVAVSVADTGLHHGNAATMHPDLLGRTPAFFYYGALDNAADEHSHGTHCAGIVAGNGATGEADDAGNLYGLGVAPGASLVTQRIFDGAGGYQPPSSYVKLTRDALSAGAVIGSNSWGDDTQGRYDISASEFDALVRDADDTTSGDQPYILEFSAGNAGPGQQTIGSPAVGKNVLATGAAQNDRFEFFIYDTGQETMADFSSRGPCEDGRIKPDIVAPGTWISSLLSGSSTDENAWAPISPNYIYMGGTSQAGPHASGAAAVLVQWWRATHTNATPSPALVKAALINSAADMDDTVETAPVPNDDEGWGRIDLTALIGSPRDYDFVDQATNLTQGQVFERRVVIASGNEPLRVTLAYTDVPGLPAVFSALVNDLDLEVVGPDGELYRGNQFRDGESVPNAPLRDTVNNVECVFIGEPAPGEYLVRVRAVRVAEDAIHPTPAVDQDFALVISGETLVGGAGLVTLDRGSYRAPDPMRVRVFDRDLAGLATTTVSVRSATEIAGETLTLHAYGTGGAFTGAIATITGPAVADGKLQIAHGNWIEARYFDASAATNRVATANADLISPVITSVLATNQFGETTLHWTTDEPATSIVRFGTNNVLNRSATNTDLVFDHAVVLNDLPPNTTHQYFVVSSDEAGNTATNNRGGLFYTFTSSASMSVLVVDSAASPIPGFFDPAPITDYTGPLEDLGLPHDVWSTATRGQPSANNLAAYRLVLWRVGEFDNGWNATQRSMISNYVASGGALLLASAEVLTRLTNAGGLKFVQEVLQVTSFVEDAGITEVASTGDAVGKDIYASLDYTYYDDNWAPDFVSGFPDTISPGTNAVPIFDDGNGGLCGLRWPRKPSSNGGRLVFCSFLLDTLPLAERTVFLREAVNFLAPGLGGFGTVALDSAGYRSPSVGNIEVGDSDQIGRNSLTVKLLTESQPAGITVTLYEQGTKGLFSGQFQIVPTNAAPGPGAIRARHGDTLRAEYTDYPGTSIVLSTAAVDNLPPVISTPTPAPDYISATMNWTTDEPCDSLVQFGESPILSRTAYLQAPETYHEVTLEGLQPDTLYYYRVTSRDPAGNVATNDNAGALHKFRTLKPLSPPFVDHFEAGATNWSVYSSDDTAPGDGWALGVPHNGQEEAAYSPTHAWGTCLDGRQLDYSETFLLSPTIHLTGGNHAMLRFAHSYDFVPRSEFDIYEVGTVYLVLDGVESVVVAQFGYDAANWEEVPVDLTPYMGRLVNVVFAYQLISFDSVARPGWLVDDVSITVTNIVTDVNANGIPDDWELAEFGVVSPQRTASTDTDGDGVSDYGEYLAGTDPLNPPPTFRVTLARSGPGAAGPLKLEWAAFPGLKYRVHGSKDLKVWTPYSALLTTATTNLSLVLGTPTNGAPAYFRVEAVPNGTNAANLRLLATRLADGSVRLQWTAATGRSYRVYSATTATGSPWTTASGWLTFPSDAGTFTVPAATANPRPFYRLEVQKP